MPDLPSDLKPLTLYPSEMPLGVPLDIEECRTALWLESGNISAAAARMKTTSQRLRVFVKKSPYLTREIEEARECLVDKAEDVIREDLNDPDKRSAAARFVLGSQGKGRGWGQGAPTVNVGAGGTFVVAWADGTSLSPVDAAKNIMDITPTKADNG